MIIKQDYIKKGSKARRGKLLKKINGVTVHNTGNHDNGANAGANARYLHNNENNTIAGFHWVVDEKEAIALIPENEITEHTGKRLGNDSTVGVEICDNADGDILVATDNGAKIVSEILKRQGFVQAVHGENIFQHNTWSGKNCPEDIRAGKPYSWAVFVDKVNAHMKNVPQQPIRKRWGVIANDLRLRTKPSTVTGKVIVMLHRGDEVQLDYYVASDKWARVIVNGQMGWVYSKFIREV
ncbi:MAG: N-acetylmuramoyl-L-alanine amidase [Christensenellaceae bacterium]